MPELARTLVGGLQCIQEQVRLAPCTPGWVACTVSSAQPAASGGSSGQVWYDPWCVYEWPHIGACRLSQMRDYGENYALNYGMSRKMWRAALRMPVARPAAVLKTQWERIASSVEWHFAGDSEHLRHLPNFYSKQNVVSYMLEKNCRNWTIFCRLHGMVEVKYQCRIACEQNRCFCWYWPGCLEVIALKLFYMDQLPDWSAEGTL